MAVDYLQALKQFSDGGGTDINAFLKQHVQPAAAPAAPGVAPATPMAAAPAPATPVGTAPLVNPSVNVLRQAFQTQDAAGATGTTGGVSAFPKPMPTTTGAVGSTAAVRNPIASRNLYPPAADQGRILGTAPAAMPIVSAPPAANPGIGASPVSAPVMAPAPARPRVQKMTPTPEIDQHDFRLPSEKKTGRDFRTGTKVAEADSPPGAPPYMNSPLANPRPTTTPAPRPAGQRMASSGITALPRKRNQRAADTSESRIFAA